MFCGSASLTHIVDDDLWEPSTPTCGLRRKVNKNPYSDRGLDKFEKVLAELEARKEKIVSETGSEGPIPVIRFFYSNSQEWVPIIVRPPPSQEKKQEPPIKGAIEANNKKSEVVEAKKNDSAVTMVSTKKIMKKSLSISEREILLM
ncbi:hypothetical protein QJS10_CPB17g02238 [Acorus calamus]|uniref:Uncharacterized protein n=1 Tax=Acorus calamus TaxID=4465 RepID=A0AAV9CWN0_ACOCL|nr:hypothetical protein QJS10_CPB17g02238 [Acorus calamus]